MNGSVISNRLQKAIYLLRMDRANRGSEAHVRQLKDLRAGCVDTIELVTRELAILERETRTDE